jgi:hypothetical protein
MDQTILEFVRGQTFKHSDFVLRIVAFVRLQPQSARHVVVLSVHAADGHPRLRFLVKAFGVANRIAQ